MFVNVLSFALSCLEVVDDRYRRLAGCVGCPTLFCFVLEGWLVNIGEWVTLVFDMSCLFSCSEDPKIAVVTYDRWLEGIRFLLS